MNSNIVKLIKLFRWLIIVAVGVYFAIFLSLAYGRLNFNGTSRNEFMWLLVSPLLMLLGSSIANKKPRIGGLILVVAGLLYFIGSFIETGRPFWIISSLVTIFGIVLIKYANQLKSDKG